MTAGSIGELSMNRTWALYSTYLLPSYLLQIGSLASCNKFRMARRTAGSPYCYNSHYRLTKQMPSSPPRLGTISSIIWEVCAGHGYCRNPAEEELKSRVLAEETHTRENPHYSTPPSRRFRNSAADCYPGAASKERCTVLHL